MNKKLKGYICGALAAASYGLNPTFALPLYADGMNPDSVLLLRYGLAIPIIALMLFARGRSLRIPKGSIVPLGALGILMALSSLTLFVSYQYMAAGIASTILFVYPVMVAVIMALFFKEKLTMHTILCILLATSGIVLLYYSPSGEKPLSFIGTMLVLLSALSYAVYLVAINQKRLAGIPTLTVTFYVLCFGILLFAGRLAGGVELTLPSKWHLWLDAVALAVFPTVVSLSLTTIAIQSIGSTSAAILGALEPVTAVVMGIILFGEGMTGTEAFGIVVILVAVTFVIAGNSLSGSEIARHLTRFRHMFPKLGRKNRNSQEL